MITEKLTNIILGTDYDNLPEEVINKAKLCFIDFLGVALGDPEPRVVKQL